MSTRPPSTAPPVPRRHARAFSLVELLVVIGVVGALLGILVPALRGVRVRVDEAVTLANLRHAGLSFESYGSTYRGSYPFVARFTWLHIQPPDDSPPTMMTDDPWVLAYAWPAVMHWVAPWRQHDSTWINRQVEHDPGRPWMNSAYGPPATVWPSFEYSTSFQARPRVWTSIGDVSAADLAPTYLHEVAFPTSKVLLFDADRLYHGLNPPPTRSRPLLFADGSASLRSDRDALAPAPNRLRLGEPRIYHDTASGVLGRDFAR